MAIGKRLKAARRAAGLTQTDLAAAIGVSQPTVANWEKGGHEPNRANLERVARATGASRGWLAFGQSESGRPGADRKEGGIMSDDATGVIAFQGIPGAYSHLACRQTYPQMEPLACGTFEDAFAAVEDGRAAIAMIPIENSLGGRVADIHHLLPDSSLYIIAEHFQPVQHNLLASKGATLRGLKTVRSHVQALTQCRDTIRDLRLATEIRADTAGAAAEVAELGDPSVAAIASSLAGEIYGLDVLRERVEDRLGNVTRFVVMSRLRQDPDPRDGPALTSIVFQVRSVPAALYKAMGGFATNGVNTIRLESYISVTNQDVARFYAEIEGHPADKHVDRALDELQYFSTKVKILGVYPAHPFRPEEM